MHPNTIWQMQSRKILVSLLISDTVPNECASNQGCHLMLLVNVVKCVQTSAFTPSQRLPVSFWVTFGRVESLDSMIWQKGVTALGGRLRPVCVGPTGEMPPTLGGVHCHWCEVLNEESMVDTHTHSHFYLCVTFINIIPSQLPNRNHNQNLSSL